MGTRHLTLVQHNNKIVVAQYGQWDGYPKGQGKTVLDFLTTANLNKFKKQLDKVYFIDDTSPIMKKVDRAIDRYYKLYHTFFHINDYRKQEKATFKAMRPDDLFLFKLFTRDTGAKILNIIYKAKNKTKIGIPLYDSSEFAGDSLFCEWAYLINLDENTLEVYRGFNHQPLDIGERFYGAHIANPKYRPIKLIKTFKLNRLPKEKTFYKTLTTLKNKFDKVNDDIEKSLTPVNTKE